MENDSYFGLLAQLAERSAHNRLVVGSSPTQPTSTVFLSSPDGGNYHMTFHHVRLYTAFIEEQE